MSYSLIDAVHRSRIEPRLRHLAQTLAHFAGDDGRDVWPGIARLMRAMGASDRAVRYGLQELVDSGVLVHDGFEGHTRRYRFDLDGLRRYQPSQRTRDEWRATRPKKKQQQRQGGTTVPGSDASAACGRTVENHPQDGTVVPTCPDTKDGTTAHSRRHDSALKTALPFQKPSPHLDLSDQYRSPDHKKTKPRFARHVLTEEKPKTPDGADAPETATEGGNAVIRPPDEPLSDFASRTTPEKLRQRREHWKQKAAPVDLTQLQADAERIADEARRQKAEHAPLRPTRQGRTRKNTANQ